MSKHGKNYRNARAAFDREELYSPAEAIRLLKGFETAKFDETVEAHFNLGLNVRHAEQQLRGMLMLPHGTGPRGPRRRLRRGRQGARGAGGRRGHRRHRRSRQADRGGLRRLRRRSRHSGPDERRRQAGRILGLRGKMPNPKTGTVTMDVGKAVREAKAGKLEYRTDRGANVHVTIGKKSFDERQLAENYAALIDEIMRGEARGEGPLHSFRPLTSTMGRECAWTRLEPEESSKTWRQQSPKQFQRKSPPPKTAGSPRVRGRSPAEVRSSRKGIPPPS